MIDLLIAFAQAAAGALQGVLYELLALSAFSIAVLVAMVFAPRSILGVTILSAFLLGVTLFSGALR